MTTSPRVAGKQERPARSSIRRVRRRRDFQAMEERRMRAAELFERDVRPAEVARQLGVSHQIVSDWRRVWRQGGRDALRAAGRAGRRPKLSDGQLTQVETVLANGAEANGYLGDLWTLPRVAEVIERVTGVSYHPGHVWYVLRDQLNWTWQRPVWATSSRPAPVGLGLRPRSATVSNDEFQPHRRHTHHPCSGWR